MSYLRQRRGDVTIDVLVQPRASRDEIVGVHDDRLKIRLNAPPVSGRANAALIVFLAKKLGLPASNLTIARGVSCRRKTLTIRGIDAARIRNLLS